MRTFAIVLALAAVTNTSLAHARLSSPAENKGQRAVRSFVLVNKETGRSCLVGSEFAAGSQRIAIETNLSPSDAQGVAEVSAIAAQAKEIPNCEGADLRQGQQLVAGLKGDQNAGAGLIILGGVAYWGLCSVANFAMLGEAIGSMFGSTKRGPGTIISETVCLPATLVNVGLFIVVGTINDYMESKPAPKAPEQKPEQKP
jgi:hypothetical protein